MAPAVMNGARRRRTQDTQAGSYGMLQINADEGSLKVTKLRRQTFETAIIERYRRRESSVEEALIKMSGALRLFAFWVEGAESP